MHLGHPLAKAVIQRIKGLQPDHLHTVKLCYKKGGHKISQLEPYIGKRGFWSVWKLAFEGLDTEEHLIHIVTVKDDNSWNMLSQELAAKFSNIMAEEMHVEIDQATPGETLIESALTAIQDELAKKVALKNEEYYDAELDKLEHYSEEALMRLYDELKEKENELSDAKKKKQRAVTFEERQEARKSIHRLEMAYSNHADKIAQEKKRLFEEKDKEMKKLEKGLKLKIQKTCVARAWWHME